MTAPATLAQLTALLGHSALWFDPPPFDAAVCEVLGPALGPDTPHRRLLELKNGAYLWDGALHLFGACERPTWHSLRAWNAPSTWRDTYGELTGTLAFFAEDAFGDQYAYRDRGGEVVVFEAELGRVSTVAPSFLAWVELMLEHGREILPVDLLARQSGEGKRSTPGQQHFAYPPLCTVESLQGVEVGHVDAVEAMRFRGQLARTLHHLPLGTRVKIEVD